MSLVGTNRTNRAGPTMSVVEGKAKVVFGVVRVAFDPKRTSLATV